MNNNRSVQCERKAVREQTDGVLEVWRDEQSKEYIMINITFCGLDDLKSRCILMELLLADLVRKVLFKKHTMEVPL